MMLAYVENKGDKKLTFGLRMQVGSGLVYACKAYDNFKN